MKIYKKNKFILQVLSAIFIFTVIFCPKFYRIVPDAHAAGFMDRAAKKDVVKNNSQRERAMNEKGKLTREEGDYLLALARKTIEEKLFNKDLPEDDKNISEKYLEKRGTFVTLTIHHNLRGCIGHIAPQEALIDGIKINAINAAFRDPRFPPLSKEEWKGVRVEISILTEPVPLEYSGSKDLLDKLRPGIDGVIIKNEYSQSAVFLPQVWDQLPDKAEFLTHLCMKAGMNGSEWKKGNLTVYTYQVQAFEEKH
ncbi:MAG: AmmeMemoRadiSam system protein A [Desulfobacteraceae bacterium]|jgi:AmmeMemoRadiSam system protein A